MTKRAFDVDEANTNQLDPLVPRAIDLPTALPLDGRIDPAIGDVAKIFSAPEDPDDWPAWREALRNWRYEARKRLDYQGTAYDDPDTAWASRCYSVGLAWLWDERLFDHAEQRFTPEKYLAFHDAYGGLDGVVLWHAYPVIGIDDRNQFDFYRLVPGIRELVSAFQERGVRVFLNYNPWDVGTRRPEHDDATELSLLCAELGVDGVFLDTLKEGTPELIEALRGTTPPQVLEGESRVALPRVEDHQLSWAQWFADSAAPGVLRAHWYERRHMMHQTRRWNRDHSDELQSSWMNGTGVLVWDAVFGVWVGWNARDRDTLRRMLSVQRALADVFIDGEWTPLVDAVPEAIAAGIYASRFELESVTVWTIVNRGKHNYRGPVIVAAGGGEWLDLGAGEKLTITAGVASVAVPARGVTAIVRAAVMTPALEALLAAAVPTSTDSDFPAREVVRTVPSRSLETPPDDAIRLTAGTRKLQVTYRRRETGLYHGAPYVEEWKPLPPRLHDDREELHEVDLGDVALARQEVTVDEFSRFRPVDGPQGSPVTGISLEEARAYAEWRGARIPTEFEWQAAAGDPAFSRLTPRVWNWTESEHSDGITRFVMLKGGSDYRADGSDWYFDGGLRESEFSAKYLLAGFGVGSSTDIGFRLAWDVGGGGDS